MKAAILVAQGQPLVVDRVELPDHLEAGQVLVRVLYSGVCGSQIGEIDGVKGDDPFLPHLLGHEGAGTVLAVGPGVTRVVAGDRVVLHWMKAAGLDAPPPVYRWNGNPVNAGRITTFNEYAIVSENRVTSIPRDFRAELATMLGCCVTTGLGVVLREAKVIPEESVVVFGVGGVGVNVVQGAALVSAYPIVAVDRRAAALDLAMQLGATHTIDGTTLPARDAVLGIVGPHGADVVVETTGDSNVIELAYRLTQPHGRTVLVGVPRFDRPVTLHTLPLHLGKSLIGSQGGAAEPDIDVPRCIGLAGRGRLNLEALITKRVPLEHINQAFAEFRQGEIAGRCLIEFSAPGANHEVQVSDVVVIGSNSFSGSDFIDLLLEETDYRILGVSRSPEKGGLFLRYRKRADLSRFRFRQIDLNHQMSELCDLLQDQRPAYVVNFASQSEVAPSWLHPEQWFQTNAVAVAQLANFLKNQVWLKCYVHISTPEIYGPCETRVAEDHSMNPSTPYAASRAAGELMLSTLVKALDFPLVVIRSANVCGAHQQLHKLIPRSVIYLKSGRKIPLHGGGRQMRSFVHVRDISRGELAAMRRAGSGEIYNLAAEQATVIRDVVRMICERMGKRADEVTDVTTDRQGQDSAYLLDCSNARENLGWSPRCSLEDAIRETVEWLEAEWSSILLEPHAYIHKA